MERYLYRVKLRVTGEDAEAVAGTFYDACKALGWLVGDCWCEKRELVALPALEPEERGS